ncbi:beta-ketoacyl synthase N-terminal-like domain-containing protein [Streptomyces canus]|uniref:type I polyketide synthase n=1 Tax=Streptomyces canus TaxID=58343 RepID=UPI0036941156
MTSNADEERDIERIAVVGMAARVPGAANVTEFWANLRNGVESITYSTEEELLAAGLSAELVRHPDFVPAHGTLSGSFDFDAEYFGYSAREAELIDPQQRVFLECAAHALQTANLAPPHTSDRTAVFAGAGANGYVGRNILSRPDLVEAFGWHHIMLGNDKDFLATRAAYRLGLTGPAMTVQTACSTSLVAVHMACQSLLSYECDTALAGGVRVGPVRHSGYLYQQGGIGSPDGHCRAYDAAAQGTIGGDGVGIVVLKRLSDALADNDTIHAVILGSAINNDGADKAGFTAPSIPGQAEAIDEALQIAGIDASTVSYVEGHGTGTPLGDPIEVAALSRAFRRHTDARQYCALGTVKPNIGHLDTAAGVVGLIKTVLALKHREIPASLNFASPNPAIDFEASPFYVNTRLTPWETRGSDPRRAGVSSFGLGGTNAHVVLEEAPSAPEPVPGSGPELLVVSARTRAALAAASAQLGRHLREHPELELADAAHTLRTGRRTQHWRRSVVAGDRAGAVAALEDPVQASAEAFASDAKDRPVYFMFPGGGTAYPEMCKGLYEAFPTFRAALDECAAILRGPLGLDLREVLYPAPDRREEAAVQLARGAVNLPAIVVVEYALSRLLMDRGVQPRAMIGHSLGEYTAACLSGVLSLRDCLELVALRGELFDSLPPGAMLSVTAAAADVAAVLPPELDIAAVNGPESCVVSGPLAEIDRFEAEAALRGLSTVRINAPGAAHSSLIDAVLPAYRKKVESVAIGAPQIPYLSNVTGDWADERLLGEASYWTGHLRGTVRFSDGISGLIDHADGVFLEVGPGRGLSTLARQHGDGEIAAVTTLRRADDPTPDVSTLWAALARLWVDGGEVDWQAFASAGRRRVTLPGDVFERREYWVEPGSSSALASLRAPGARGGQRPVEEWFDTPAWRPAPLPSLAMRPVAGERWLILADDDALGREVTDRLTAAGAEVTEVRRSTRYYRTAEGGYELDPGAAGHYTNLIADLAANNRLPGHVLHLWTLGGAGAPGHVSVAALEDAQPGGLYSLLFLAQALEEHGDAAAETTIHLAGASLQSVTGTETLRPGASAVLGACRVLPQEYGMLSCQVVDLERPTAGGTEAATAARLLAEFTSGDAAVVVYRGGRRLTPGFEPVPLPAPATDPLRIGGSYLVTGGADEFGEAIAGQLADVYRAHVTLLERPHFPAESQWDGWLAEHGDDDPTSSRIRAIGRLRDGAGDRLHVVTADLSSATDLWAAVDRIEEQTGALHGVLHTAGLAEERTHHLVRDTDMAVCQAHFRLRVHSTVALAEVLADRSLDFRMLVSTLSAQLGGIGRAASSAALSCAATYVQGRPEPWTVTDWDDGQFQIAADRDTSLGPPFTPAQTREAISRMAALPDPVRLVVLADDLPARAAYWQRRDAAGETSAAQGRAAHPRPPLATPYEPPGNSIEEEIAGVWQLLLGIEPVGVNDDFFSLGGHSLLGTKLIAKLRSLFNIDLPLRELFEHPTVAAMAERVVQRSVAESDADKLEALLTELEHLDEGAANHSKGL